MTSKTEAQNRPSAAVQAILDSDKNTSQKIRALAAEGLSRGLISNLLGKRYQHVRNVLITPVKTA